MRLMGLLSSLLLLAACASSAPPKVDENVAKRVDTQVQLARGYMANGKLEVALDNINKALQLDPASVDAHTVAAIINRQIGRVDQATRHFQRAVELEPENGDLLNNYGTLLHQQGRYDEAIVHFEKALEQPFYRTPAAALSNAGASAEQQNRTEVAEQYYRRALERDPNYPDALFRLARIKLNQQQPLQARAFLQRLETRTTPLPEVLWLGYQIECAMGDTDTAQSYAKKLRSSFPDSEQSRALKEADDSESCQPAKLRSAAR